MKTILLLLSFVFVSSCVTSGLKARAVASESCNAENYQDFIYKQGKHNCFLRWVHFRNRAFYTLFGFIQIPANLRGANFEGADLVGADFTGADLRGANLREADLRGVSFYEADLEEADLRGAKFQKKEDLTEQELRDWEMSGRYWGNTETLRFDAEHFQGANFRRANLQKALVTQEQAEYLTAQGLSGFVVVE